jgi:hypothetical protein
MIAAQRTGHDHTITGQQIERVRSWFPERDAFVQRLFGAFARETVKATP